MGSTQLKYSFPFPSSSFCMPGMKTLCLELQQQFCDFDHGNQALRITEKGKMSIALVFWGTHHTSLVLFFSEKKINPYLV